MNDYTVVQAGERVDTQYFAKDFSKVHCFHGNFIGYPGGVDYICPDCEDGRFTPCALPAVTVFLGVGDSLGEFKTYYSLDALSTDFELFGMLEELGGSVVYDFYLYHYWGTEQDESEQDWATFFDGLS